MSMMTPDIAAKAREQLKLSQALVAKETGISRSYLSQYEGSKRILEDHLISALEEFYKSNGWTADEKHQEQSVEQALNSPDHDLIIADGFVVAQEALADYILDDLLDEYYTNNAEIDRLAKQEIERGFFGGFNEESAYSECAIPLALMARQYQIIQILQGKYEPTKNISDIKTTADIDTKGDYIEVLISNATPDRVRPISEEFEEAV